jgi:glycerol-3-phosphate acyltransferase PlsY
MSELLTIPVAYLIGSIPFGLFIARMYGIYDIRLVGSGNIGATNVWRTAGPFPALLVLLCDVGKGMAAVFVALIFSKGVINVEYLKIASGLGAILGHVFPIFLLFKGGKGVNTALGVMLILIPIETLIALATFIIVVAISRYVSLGSILAAFALAVALALEKTLHLRDVDAIFIWISILLLGLILFTHRDNIGRIVSGTENRFSLRKKKSIEAGDHV